MKTVGQISEVSPGMSQPAPGFLEQLLGVAQALSPFKVRKVRAPQLNDSSEEPELPDL